MVSTEKKAALELERHRLGREGEAGKIREGAGKQR